MRVKNDASTVTSRYLFILLSLLLALASGFASPAIAAAAPSDEPISWSVRPAGTEGADGRSWIELTLSPGESALEYMEVRNLGKTDAEFALVAADGYFTENGRFNMLSRDRESSDAGTWIEIMDAVEVAAGSRAVVPVTISVPANATPGDHAAGVAASIRSLGSGGDGNAVSVESRVGFRVMTRVTGEYAPAVSAQVQAKYELSWNPFQPGTAIAEYQITNTGNTRLEVRPTVTATAFFGVVRLEVDGAVLEEMAPGDLRTGSLRLDRIWPLGILDVSITPTAYSIIDDSPPVRQDRGNGAVLAIAWPQLIAALIAVALVTALVRDRRRRRRNLARQLEQARDQGRREASGTAGDAVVMSVFALVIVGGLLLSPVPAHADTDESVTVKVRIEERESEPQQYPQNIGDSLPATGVDPLLGAIAGSIALGVGSAFVLRSRRNRAAR